MDAIPQDVSEEESIEKTEEVLSAHEEELERIASQRQHETDDNEEVVEEQEADSPLVLSDDGWVATAKVDGEEVQIPYSEVMAQYQKNSSADKRLQQAAKRQKELEDYERQLNAYRVQLESRKNIQPSSDAEESPSSDATDDLYGQYHDALFNGDEAKANAMLKQIRSAEKPQPQIDVKGIIERTKQELREEETRAKQARYEGKRKDAVQQFHSEFSDIAGDPSLLAVADARSAELYNSDPTRDPWDIMQESGEYAREWLMIYVDELSGAKNEERQERKQSMDEVTPRNVRSSLGEDQAEPTYSEIIAEMKSDRGQHT